MIFFYLALVISVITMFVGLWDDSGALLLVGFVATVILVLIIIGLRSAGLA